MDNAPAGKITVSREVIETAVVEASSLMLGVPTAENSSGSTESPELDAEARSV